MAENSDSMEEYTAIERPNTEETEGMLEETSPGYEFLIEVKTEDTVNEDAIMPHEHQITPKRKYVRRNFDSDGKIKIELREGKERTDTYRKRSVKLIEGCENLYKLTHCHVKINIMPTWAGGKTRKYTSPRYPSTDTSGPHPPVVEEYNPTTSPMIRSQKRVASASDEEVSKSTNMLIQVAEEMFIYDKNCLRTLQSHDEMNLDAKREDTVDENTNITLNENQITPRRKYVRRNFDIDGKIKIELRTGRDRSDTYRKRSLNLIEGCENLYKLTHCHVKINIMPTWAGGKTRNYTSPGYPTDEETSSSMNVSSIVPSIQGSPDKFDENKKRRASQNLDEINADQCGICGIKSDDSTNLKDKFHWLHCQHSGKRRCEYWVHSTCVGIYYPYTKHGQVSLDKWAVGHFFCPKHMPKPK